MKKIGKHIKKNDTLKNNKETKSINDNSSNIAKNTASMAIATLGSRVTGLMRTWMMAFALGNTVITSAYQVANNMPNVIFDLVAGGLMNAAFIPIFMSQKEQFGKDGGDKFSSNILNMTILIMGTLSVLSTIFAPYVIATQTFTVDSQAQVTETSIMFFRIFAFQILFYGISAVLTGILNGERIYFMPAFAPALNNIIVILAFVSYFVMKASNIQGTLPLIILAAGTTLGVVVQALIQIPALLKTGYKWKPILNFKDPALWDALKIALPTFIYIIGTLCAFTCRNAFSLHISENGPASILYAWTWYQLPFGVVAVSVSRTMFTEMSDAVAKNDYKSLRLHVNKGLSSTLILIIPLSMMMYVFAIPLLSLFRAGQFNADDVQSIANILQAWLISLPFYSCVMYLYNAYAAIRKFHIFAIINIIAVVFQCLLYWATCTPEFLDIYGIPITDSIYYIVSFFIYLFLLKKYIGDFKIFSILVSTFKAFGASFLGCAISTLLLLLIEDNSPNMLTGILELCICGSIGLVIVFIFYIVFKIPEANMVFDLIKKKILKR